MPNGFIIEIVVIAQYLVCRYPICGRGAYLLVVLELVCY